MAPLESLEPCHFLTVSSSFSFSFFLLFQCLPSRPTATPGTPPRARSQLSISCSRNPPTARLAIKICGWQTIPNYGPSSECLSMGRRAASTCARRTERRGRGRDPVFFSRDTGAAPNCLPGTTSLVPRVPSTSDRAVSIRWNEKTQDDTLINTFRDTKQLPKAHEPDR